MPDEFNPTSTSPGQSGGAPAPEPQQQQDSSQPAQGAPAPSPAGVAGYQGQQQDFRSTLQARGIDASPFQSDQQAIEYYSRLQPQYVQQLAQKAQLADRLMPEFRRLQAELQARGEAQGMPPAQAAAQATQQAAAAQQQAKTPYWPERPEWKPEWDELVKIGPDGRPVLADQMLNPALIEKHQAMQRWKRERAEALLNDPRKALQLDEYATEREEKLKAEVAEMIQAQFQQVQQQAQASSYVQDNSRWLFRTDPQTNQPVIDPTTGKYVFNDDGAQFHQVLGRLSNNPDERTLADIALLAVYGMRQAAGQQQQPAPPPSGNGQQQFMPPPQQQIPYGQQPFLGSTYNPNRGGTVLPSPVSAPQQTGQFPQDVESALRHAMRQAGQMQ